MADQIRKDCASCAHWLDPAYAEDGVETYCPFEGDADVGAWTDGVEWLDGVPTEESTHGDCPRWSGDLMLGAVEEAMFRLRSIAKHRRVALRDLLTALTSRDTNE